jgi:hypothetical protein
MKGKLPSYEDAQRRVTDGRATALELFINENEPAGERDELAFRAGLCAVVLEAESAGWDAYHRLMSLLRDAQLPHGKCQPRSRRACTHCNAREEIDEMVKGYKGRFIQHADMPPADSPVTVGSADEQSLS